MDPENELKSRFKPNRGRMFVIIGIVNAWVAYFIFKIPRLTFHLNDRVVTYNRADTPAPFNAATAIAAVAAILFVGTGLRMLLVRSEKPTNRTKPVPRGRWPRVWCVVNTALFFLSTWAGYGALSVNKLRGTNPDLMLCVSAFVVMALFAIAAPHFATVATFRRPQWGRFPLSWWRDPMQALFITTCLWAGWVVGSTARLFTFNLSRDKTAVWTVLTYTAILAGLLVGQAVAYLVYRDRIET